MRIVLEEDGTDVDDDAILEAEEFRNKTLLLLMPGEVWESSMVPLILQESPDIFSSATPSTSVSLTGSPSESFSSSTSDKMTPDSKG